MSRVTGTTQMPDNIIGMKIDKHPPEKYDRTDDKLRGGQPRRRVHIRGREIKYPSPLHTCIKHVERDSHKHDTQRHTSLTLQQKRENERTLEIMYLEKKKE